MRAVVMGLLLAACSVETGAIPPGTPTGDADVGVSDSGVPPVDAPSDSPRRDSTVDTGTPSDGAPPDAPADAPLDTGIACVPTAETCNATDDDCDLAIDEAGCGCERELHGGHVYLFCTGGRTFDDATADCAGWGYHQAFIDDAAEQAFAWGEASRRITTDWWIGLSDIAMEGRYEWLDGTVVWEGGVAVGYHAFRGGAPDDQVGEDCFEMDAAGGVWAGATCSQAQPYVCEAP